MLFMVLTMQKFVAFCVSVLFLSPDAARLRTSFTLWLGAAAIVTGSAVFSSCSAPGEPSPCSTKPAAEVHDDLPVPPLVLPRRVRRLSAVAGNTGAGVRLLCENGDGQEDLGTAHSLVKKHV